ncbi:TPA: DNA primase [Candidatus Woesearchaeota archaeon]|nr:DNA primase [Candidatus Woesearchaeota archaeon]HIH55291.1 DNA primase [Candidatus Woesearchaeota archaeon]HIJ01534.1 DNA primase [Candidatus Woesearchaeota archaeon]HIJ13838.1 DNA primase [Candidatus Woesearchaeota archaeon]
MGKINPVSSKYIVHTSIQIDGVVDKPDVIGAIFGQTEGLLGSDLELRELQRSGKIGRIEVNLDTRSGKTKGEIILPSSLDKAETAIIGAALEIIQRIGPCNAKVRVENIEDVRISKRQFVIERAKELLRTLTDAVLPNSQEIAEEVAASVRVMEITEYGRERLPAGPDIEESQEIIVVEGRADVINLLKNGFKNCIAINGTSIPQTIIELCKKKTVTVFVDGDRGGSLIVQELLSVTDVDFVTRAPDGKELEELTKKEIHKCLRARIAAEQVKLEIGVKDSPEANHQQEEMTGDAFSVKKQVKPMVNQRSPQPVPQPVRPVQTPPRPVQSQQPPRTPKKPTQNELEFFNDTMEDLIGTRAAFMIDEKLNVLGKIPVSELISTIRSLSSGVYAIMLDDVIDQELLNSAERANVMFLVAMDTKVKSSRLTIITADEL